MKHRGLEFLAIALCVAAAPAPRAAKPFPAIALDPLPGEAAADVETVVNHSGTCGPSVVRVLGVTYAGDGLFALDFDGRVIVRQSSRPDLVVTSDNGLSDHNGVACVRAGARSFILLWSNCSGAWCGNGYNFKVVDADRVAVISPDDCSASCATKLTGSDLPRRLNAK